MDVQCVVVSVTSLLSGHMDNKHDGVNSLELYMCRPGGMYKPKTATTLTEHAAAMCAEPSS